MTYPTGTPRLQEWRASVIVNEKPSSTTVPPTFIPLPPWRSWDSGTPLDLRSPTSSKIPTTSAPVCRARRTASAAWSKWSWVSRRKFAFGTPSGPLGAVGFPWNHGSTRTVLPEGSWMENPECPYQRILTGGMAAPPDPHSRGSFFLLYRCLLVEVKRKSPVFLSLPSVVKRQ